MPPHEGHEEKTLLLSVEGKKESPAPNSLKENGREKKKKNGGGGKK